MSSGGVFQLITNEGKSDKMILASQILTKRIDMIRNQKRAAALASGLDPEREDLDPTLSQIQESHIIHFQSKFKPYVATAMEYQKVTPQSGGAAFGNQVIFSLPQFGDFFTDMVLNVHVSGTSIAPGAIPAVPADSPVIDALNNQPQASVTLLDGSIVKAIDADAEVVRQFEYMGHVDASGKMLAPGDLVADKVHWCDFPGERMIRSVKFDVNGNPLDEYSTYNYVFDRLFRLKEDKKAGYFRSVGQEWSVDAKSLPLADGVRLGGKVFSGLQTPKTSHGEWRMWQKLLFWFNEDHSNALPSAAIPFGQRQIIVQLADVESLVFRAPASHLVVKTTNRFVPGTQFIKNPDGTFDLSAGLPVRNTWYEYHYLPVYTQGAITYPTIKSIQLYANNLFTLPVVHDLFIKRVGFSLIRVHKNQQSTINRQDTEMLMNQFKFPIEHVFIGVVPDENVSGAHQATDWCQFGKVSHKYTKQGVFLTTEANHLHNGDVLHYQERTRTVDALEVSAHGMSLYQKLDAEFYNQYKPLVFGKDTLVTPSDSGALLVNFALNPYDMQPSGHMNVSRAREFYIKVYSSVIGLPNASGATQSGQMVSAARAINFLLISDGSAVLRYST